MYTLMAFSRKIFARVNAALFLMESIILPFMRVFGQIPGTLNCKFFVFLPKSLGLVSFRFHFVDFPKGLITSN